MRSSAGCASPSGMLSLRVAIGPKISNDAILALLDEADGDVERAANLYFDRSNVLHAPQKAASISSRFIDSLKLKPVETFLF